MGFAACAVGEEVAAMKRTLRDLWERIEITWKLWGRLLDPNEMRNWLPIEWGYKAWSKLTLAQAWKIAGEIIESGQGEVSDQ